MYHHELQCLSGRRGKLERWMALDDLTGEVRENASSSRSPANWVAIAKIYLMQSAGTISDR